MLHQKTEKYDLHSINPIITNLNMLTRSTAVFLCDGDGHIITISDNCNVPDIASVAALVAIVHGVGKRANHSLTFGEKTEFVLKGEDNILLTWKISAEVFIGVIASKDANQAMINLLTQNAIMRLMPECLNMTRSDNPDSFKIQANQELAQLLTVTPKECYLLKSLQPDAQKIAAEMADTLYERLTEIPTTREYISDPGVFKTTLATWFAGLFCGNYDEDYLHERWHGSSALAQIGLPLCYPLALSIIPARFGERVARLRGEETIEAFRKVLAFDIATLAQAYDSAQFDLVRQSIGGSDSLARRVLANQF